MDKILEVKNLKISFRTNGGTVKAVRDISFDLERGKTLAIVGESGSGKSVTSKAILGIVKLGTAESTSLGTLLSDASSIWTNYPHLMIYPALVISLMMICFNLFGNGLRDAFNPALRGVED